MFHWTSEVQELLWLYLVLILQELYRPLVVHTLKDRIEKLHSWRATVVVMLASWGFNAGALRI